MNIEEANRQQVYLLNSIDNASKALILFELLRSKKFTTGTVKQNNWLEEILLSFIILKIHTIFDKSRNAVCLERFLKNEAQHITTEKDKQNILRKFESIKIDHQILIKQIENNRHEEVAHIAQKMKLGVIEKVANKIRELGSMIGNESYINQKSVSVDKMRFSVGNFPVAEVKDITKRLLDLIFGIKYPRTLDKIKNENLANKK
ncbi:MAG: hypothetical protein Q8Q17_02980 [bacterium]|nr:hypothetical protein [bacterium]